MTIQFILWCVFCGASGGLIATWIASYFKETKIQLLQREIDYQRAIIENYRCSSAMFRERQERLLEDAYKEIEILRKVKRK